MLFNVCVCVCVHIRIDSTVWQIEDRERRKREVTTGVVFSGMVFSQRGISTKTYIFFAIICRRNFFYFFYFAIQSYCKDSRTTTRIQLFPPHTVETLQYKSVCTFSISTLIAKQYFLFFFNYLLWDFLLSCPYFETFQAKATQNISNSDNSEITFPLKRTF